MSAIAIPPSPRPASRGRTRGGVTGHLGGRAVARASSRPRLLLVTDDFVPMAPTHGAADDATRRPMAAPATDSTELPMRRPSAPVALRGRRQELERLAPEHPAVRAARRRDRAQRDRGRQAVRQDAAAPSGNRQDRQGRTIRFQTEPRFLRRGSLAVIAAIALACCGFALGGLAGLASPTSAAAQPPVGTAATVTTVVRPGQSLWEIAAASGTTDVSATVARIVELNDLQSTTVRAGQSLEVPVS